MSFTTLASTWHVGKATYPTRLARFLFLFFVYLSIAAASFNGFYQKWGMRADPAAGTKEARYSFASMVEGTAHRPFVYRQLIPQAANLIEATLSPGTKDWIIERLLEDGKLKTRLEIDPDKHRDYVIRYHLVYYMSFGLLLLALYVMRAMCLRLGFSPLVATLAPGLFVLTLPYFETHGGFFYDFPEVFFLSLAFYIALASSWLYLIPVTILAELNKEAFFFFLIALFPILRTRHSDVASLVITTLLVGIAGLTYLGVKAAFADNPGTPVESWIMGSLRYYTDPLKLLQLEVNYGIVTPQGYSLFSFVLIGLLYWGAWRGLAVPVRQHILMMIAINAPLVFIFCGPGEMRNFSLCYIGFMIVIAQNLAQWTATPGVCDPRHAAAGAKDLQARSV
jgi:hypothetical protein